MLNLKSLIEEIADKRLQINLKVDKQSVITLMTTGIGNRHSKHTDALFFYSQENSVWGYYCDFLYLK